MNIDELFQKINKECYEIATHKNKLRKALLNDTYFTKKQKQHMFGFKYALPALSLFFSISMLLLIQMMLPTNYQQSLTLYARLSKNNNTAILKDNTTKTLEINQANTKTILRFNNNKILIGSGVNNK